MTLEELIQRVPEPWRPVVSRYGPALLKMSADELWAWIELLLAGRDEQAYRAVLARMDESDLLAEWDSLAGQWQSANEAAARRRDTQARAVQAVLHVLLTAALAMVGL